MSRLVRTLLPVLMVAGVCAPGVRAGDLAGEAIRLCEGAEQVDAETRDRMLARGVQLAQAAVTADDGNARAHFALFCTQARQVEAAGLSFGTMLTVRRLHGVVDRALELDPNYVDALVAKAGMLRRLPRFFGGDRDEARRCLERALALDPGHPVARRYAIAEGVPVDPSVVLAGQAERDEPGWK